MKITLEDLTKMLEEELNNDFVDGLITAYDVIQNEGLSALEEMIEDELNID